MILKTFKTCAELHCAGSAKGQAVPPHYVKKNTLTMPAVALTRRYSKTKPTENFKESMFKGYSLKSVSSNQYV